MVMRDLGISFLDRAVEENVGSATIRTSNSARKDETKSFMIS
jgi:hypothetical protein